MSNRARVREVVHSRLAVLGHGDGQRQQIVQDGVGVGDVDDAVVLCDFGDEGARVQVVGDGHADAQGEGVGGVGRAEDVFDARLGDGVEAAAEVGGVGFGEGCAGEGVAGGVVLGGVDACCLGWVFG